jgi:hypothetical protein
MLRLIQTSIFLTLLSWTTFANADVFEGAPNGTVLKEHTITHSDPDFVGEVMLGQRSDGSRSELILWVRVRGFSLNFEAGVDGKLQAANETSYYNPTWHSRIISDSPSFVWWESDESTSTHIFKIPNSESTPTATGGQLNLMYVNENSESQYLAVSFN